MSDMKYFRQSYGDVCIRAFTTRARMRRMRAHIHLPESPPSTRFLLYPGSGPTRARRRPTRALVSRTHIHPVHLTCIFACVCVCVCNNFYCVFRFQRSCIALVVVINVARRRRRHVIKWAFLLVWCECVGVRVFPMLAPGPATPYPTSCHMHSERIVQRAPLFSMFDNLARATWHV